MAAITLHQRYTNRNEDYISFYFKDIAKYPILTPEEEKEVATEARKGNKRAMDKLMLSNLRFVITVAKQYQGKGLSLGDLIQFGNLGLANALTKFDPEKGYRFMSYAIWWVRQSIVQALSNYSRTIRIPYTKASSLHKIMVAKGQYEQINGREPTIEELAKSLHMSVKEVKDILEAPKLTSALENPFSNDEDSGSLIDIIPNNSARTDENLNNKDDLHIVEMMINKLDNRTHDILMMVFGINGVEQMPLAEIGARFNIGEERIRQIKNKALKQLKERYSAYI